MGNQNVSTASGCPQSFCVSTQESEFLDHSEWIPDAKEMNSSSGKQVIEYSENQLAEGHQELGQRPPLRRQDASEEILTIVEPEAQQPKQGAGLATNKNFSVKTLIPIFTEGGGGTV